MDAVGLTDPNGSVNNAQVLFAAYSNSFNPIDLSQNYLGDAGGSCVLLGAGLCTGLTPFSVLVGAGQTVVLNISKVIAKGPVRPPAVQGIEGELSFADVAGATVSFNANFTDVGTTVPEPSTYALMAFGLAGMGVVARRRRRA